MRDALAIVVVWIAAHWPSAAAVSRNFAASLGACAAVGLVEWRWTTGHRATRVTRLGNVCIGALLATGTVLVEPLLTPIAMRVAGKGGDGLLWGALPAGLRQGVCGAVLGTCGYATVWDFFQYWTHRVQHAVPWLWAMHRLHHDDPAMNTTTALRQHPIGVLVGFAMAGIPTIVLCGLHAVPGLGTLVLFVVWGHLNHADLRLRFGPFCGVLSGPQWHRLHHGAARSYHGCNFAAFFPWLDRLFGTYRPPAADEFPVTGTTDEPRRGPPDDGALSSP